MPVSYKCGDGEKDQHPLNFKWTFEGVPSAVLPPVLNDFGFVALDRHICNRGSAVTTLMKTEVIISKQYNFPRVLTCGSFDTHR